MQSSSSGLEESAVTPPPIPDRSSRRDFTIQITFTELTRVFPSLASRIICKR